MPGGPIYGVVEEQKRERGPLRKVLVPILMLIVVFYLVLLLQQAAVLLAAKAFGAQAVTLYAGMGQNLGESTLFGLRTVRGSDWWWGPQVVARALPSDLGQTVVEYVAPAVTLLGLAVIGIDLRRSRTLLHAMVLIAGVAAIMLYFALPALYPAAYR